MDVVCENCRTEYEFDESQLGTAGATVKCTQCGYLFRVSRSSAPQPTAASASAPLASHWMIRTVAGETYQIDDLSVIQSHVLERKVTRHDEVSRTGQAWKRLGEMPELLPFFNHVDRTASGNGSGGGEPAWAQDTQLAMPGSAIARPRLGTAPHGHSQPHLPPPEPEVAPPPNREWAAGPEDVSLASALPRRRISPRAWLIPVIVVGAASLVFGGLKLASSMGGDDASDQYLAARKALLRDTDDGWHDAETAFSKLSTGKEKVLALAGLASVRAAEAQADLDEAAYLERRTKAKQAQEKRRAARSRAEEARDLAKRALADAPDSLEANRAMADALRLLESQAESIESHLRRARVAMPGDPETLYVEGAFRADQRKMLVARELLSESTRRFQEIHKEIFVAAEFRLAMLDFSEGNREETRKRLDRVLANQPAHARAQKVLAELSALAGSVAPTEDVSATTPPVAAVPPDMTSKPSTPDDETTSSKPARSDSSGGDYASLIREGDRQSEQGRTAAAEKLYQKALAQRPDGVEALAGLGYCAIDQDNPGLAVTQFQRALRMDASYGDAIIGLAEAYKLQSEYEEAFRNYKRYLAVYPGGPKSRMAEKNIRDLESHLPKGVIEEDKPAAPTGPAPAPVAEPRPAPPPAAPPPKPDQVQDTEKSPYDN